MDGAWTAGDTLVDPARTNSQALLRTFLVWSEESSPLIHLPTYPLVRLGPPSGLQLSRWGFAEDLPRYPTGYTETLMIDDWKTLEGECRSCGGAYDSGSAMLWSFSSFLRARSGWLVGGKEGRVSLGLDGRK